MQCPHCLVTIHFDRSPSLIIKDDREQWHAYQQYCPACQKRIVFLERTYFVPDKNHWIKEEKFLVYPRKVARAACPTEVPDDYSDDYEEAVIVLEDSPKASAALSRRCLQLLLHEKAGAPQKNLSDQIQHVLDHSHLPSHIAESIDAVRTVGNFAAHPLKSTASGEILDVEPDEAEWNLGVLEDLFDFYFVQPPRTQARRDAHNKKLAAAGKPAMQLGSRAFEE